MRRWGLGAVVIGVLLAGCAVLGTWPGHPASALTAESAASPGNNGRIAFAVEESYPGSDAQSDSWVVTIRPDGSHPRRLLDAYASGPVAYSPGGARLAYSDLGDGLIHSLRLSSPRRDHTVTSFFYPPDYYQYDSGPDWSPTGRRIVFTRSYYPDSGGPRSELWIHYRRGGRRLTDGRSPSWSATGDIAFTGADGYLYTIRPDGSELRRVGDARCGAPDWSPDGKRLVCVGVGLDIASVRADGSDFTRLTHGPHRDTSPVFSPDGRWIAFARGESSIVTMRRNGTRLKTVAKRVSSNPDCCELIVYGPDWQPRAPR
jgi:Tol biopolymer transport system component